MCWLLRGNHDFLENHEPARGSGVRGFPTSNSPDIAGLIALAKNVETAKRYHIREFVGMPQ
jgi:hypothetical protein